MVSQARDGTAALAEKLKQSIDTKVSADGVLQTNDRIIASVTDGIYREPWSAFRELVSNAYDADATEVMIDCDYPFFNQIKISDNGNGMSLDTVADLLMNIGGSSKRTSRGKALGTVNPKDARLSPKGRKLIGKIGIGLFAVAQLTNQFQIITKRKGENVRTLATVSINTFQEDRLADDETEEYVSGSFRAIAEHAEDIDFHGTSIILLSMKPGVKNKLQSKAIWDAIDDQAEDDTLGLNDTVEPPDFHIGRLDENKILITEPKLPWNKSDSPEVKFEALFQAEINAKGNVREKSTLSHLDNYLKMLWRLSLASPLPYLDHHPFDTKGSANFDFFKFSNKKKGGAIKLEIPKNKSIRDVLNLSAGNNDPLEVFDIFVDEVKLKRPVRFPEELKGSKTLERPLLFVGSASTDFNKVAEERTGGALAFEAYFYWNSKIVPKESIGALIRVNGASGTLFDPEFLAYQVSEQTRKKQITCEIFVTKGLDGALNIDRESYNTSHPHYLFIQKWVHNAFRQFATQSKRLGKQIRDVQRAEEQKQQAGRVAEHTAKVWEKMQGKNLALPTIEETVLTSGQAVPNTVGGNKISWDGKDDTAKTIPYPDLVVPLTLVLEAYGVLDNIDEINRADLLADIMSLFEDMK